VFLGTGAVCVVVLDEGECVVWKKGGVSPEVWGWRGTDWARRWGRCL